MANLNRCRPGGRSRRQAMIGGKWSPQGTIAAPYRFGMTMILAVRGESLDSLVKFLA